MLFFGSLAAAGLIGLWLWNSNPSVRDGRAFGTANQVGSLGAGPGAGAAGEAGPLAARGQQLAVQLGCVACHTATGVPGLGPTWKGLAGSQRTLANGQTVTADDAYLRESILEPDAKVVRDFTPGVMAANVKPQEAVIGQGDNLDALIAYIKSLK